MDAALTITPRPVKHARLRVCGDGSVKLFVPEDFTPGDIDSLLRKKAGWIERQREFLRRHARNAPRLSADEVMLFGDLYRWVAQANGGRGVVVDREAKFIRTGGPVADGGRRQQWLRAFARKHLRQRVGELSQKHGLRYERCFVLSQRTRWGSCSTKKNVSLNWRLVSAPPYVIDYVILHELVHTKIMNHSHRFWVNLRTICPDHKRAVEWLNANRPPWKSATIRLRDRSTLKHVGIRQEVLKVVKPEWGKTTPDHERDPDSPSSSRHLPARDVGRQDEAVPDALQG